MMIVAPSMTLNDLMQAIVRATHQLTDPIGNRHTVQTIPADVLRVAAITAIQIACRESVWPGDRVVEIPEQKIQHGIFRQV